MHHKREKIHGIGGLQMAQNGTICTHNAPKVGKNMINSQTACRFIGKLKRKSQNANCLGKLGNRFFSQLVCETPDFVSPLAIFDVSPGYASAVSASTFPRFRCKSISFHSYNTNHTPAEE